MFRETTPEFVDPDCETALFVRTNAASDHVNDPDCETALFVAEPGVAVHSCESDAPGCYR